MTNLPPSPCLLRASSMASSTHEHQLHHLPTPYGTTSAPPPTPNNHLLSTSEASDSLSRLLHRIPPTLSLSFPGRLLQQSPPSTTISPPVISLSDPKTALHSNLLSAAKQNGLFQLTQHPISPQLAQSAESESLSIFKLSNDEKQSGFPKNNWPLGFDNDDDDVGQSFCLDSSVDELGFTSLRELTCQMEKLGLEVIQELACAVGFENPVSEQFCSLMWIAESESNRPLSLGRLYPFIVGLTYQIRRRKYSILADSGWVSVSPQIDSVMVTLGDIAQVWSNGKVKKVRGRPVAITSNDAVENNSRCVSMTLLVTLAHDNTSTIVSPLLPIKSPSLGTHVLNEEDDDNDDVSRTNIEAVDEEEERGMFNSFSFEDYAWRVYHEPRLDLLKDPLARYRAT